MAGVVSKSFYFDGRKSWNMSQTDPAAWVEYGAETTDLQYRNLVPWIGRARALRMGPIGSMPFAIYDERGEEVDNSGDYQNALNFLPQPGRLFAKIEAALLDFGRCYYLKMPNVAGYSAGLKYFVPSSIEPVIDPEKGLTKFIRRVQGTQKDYKPEQIVYFWPDDSAVEIGPPTMWALKLALSAAGVLFSVDEFAAAYFKRGAIKATILTIEGQATQLEKDKLKAWWSDMVTGIKNAFSSNIMSANVKPVVIGEGLEGLTDTNLTREQKEAIAAAYGIPFAVMFSDSASYATASSDWRGFYETTLVPEAEFIQETINEQLLDALGYHLEFQPESLDVFKDDETSRAGALSQITTAGVPLLMAMDILGYELTEEQRAELEELEAEPEPEPEPMPQPEQPIVDQAGEAQEELEAEQPEMGADVKTELARWKRKAARLGVKRKADAANFESEIIPDLVKVIIASRIGKAETDADIKAAFEIKYSDDQERDEQGGWSGGGGGSGNIEVTTEQRGGGTLTTYRKGDKKLTEHEAIYNGVGSVEYNYANQDVSVRQLVTYSKVGIEKDIEVSIGEDIVSPNSNQGREAFREFMQFKDECGIQSAKSTDRIAERLIAAMKRLEDLYEASLVQS